MYELIKKKSYGMRIVTGIAIFFVITLVLKMIFYQPFVSIDEELMKMASELNRHAPIMVDSVTRFDNAIALSGYRVDYNYTFLRAEKADVDTVYLVKTAKETLLNGLKTDPKLAPFRKEGITISAIYHDKRGNYICTATVTPDDFR
jgi:hypothetical protein